MNENKAIQAKITPLKQELNALKKKKKALNEIKMKEIEHLLTPEQFIKFQELKKNKKENRKERSKK
jgi:Spy/CpxP family protein refolding chaperone